MGFCVEEITYRLNFKDSDLSGLIVDMSPATVGTLVGFTDMASLAQLSGTPIVSMDAASLSKLSGLRTLFDSFADSLVAWNLEDKKGNPIPPTKESVYKQQFPFLIRVISAWTESISGVPENLGSELSGGKQQGVASIPTETL